MLLLHTISIVCLQPQYLFVVDQQATPLEDAFPDSSNYLPVQVNLLFVQGQAFFHRKVYFQIFLPVYWSLARQTFAMNIHRTIVDCFNSEKVSIPIYRTFALATQKIRAAANGFLEFWARVQQNAQILQKFGMISFSGWNLLHFPFIEWVSIYHILLRSLYYHPYIGGGLVAVLPCGHWARDNGATPSHQEK